MKSIMKTILIGVILILLAFSVINIVSVNSDAAKSEKDDGTIVVNGDGSSECSGEPHNC